MSLLSFYALFNFVDASETPKNTLSNAGDPKRKKTGFINMITSEMRKLINQYSYKETPAELVELL